jgi:hypothetical protein
MYLRIKMNTKYLFVTAACFVLLSWSMLPLATKAIAQEQQNPHAVDPKILPTPLTSKQEAQVTAIAVADKRVSDIINGRTYKFMSTDFLGNVSSGIWNPEVHLNVANVTEITAVVDMNSHAVNNIIESPMVYLGHTHGNYPLSQGSNPTFASNFYSGSQTVEGLLATMKAPTYTTGDQNYQTDLMLNAVEYGATEADLCSSAYYASSYWAQVGELWTQSTPYIVWTDTGFDGCPAQTTGVSYIAGHHYTAEIYTSSTSWTLFIEDTDNFASFTKIRTGMNYVVFQNNEFDNGVFLENWNTNTNWAPDFNPTSLSSTAELSTSHGGTSWSNWDEGKTQDQDCHGNRSSSSVINGNFANGGSPSWNLNTMETKVAC